MTAPSSTAAARPANRPGASARAGMVGAGQLARMCQQAAIALGIDLHVLGASEQEPAVAAGAALVLGEPADLDALRALAEAGGIVTFDHEQVPPEHLEALEAEGVTVAPPASAKRFAQDKLHQRAELGAAGLAVPPYAHARDLGAVEAFAGEHGWPVVAKAPRGGYDGRGVWVVADAAEAEEVLAQVPGGLLVEPLLDIECELAVLVARSASGACVVYPVVETVQQDAMCREIVAPARIDPGTAEQARALAVAIAERIGAVGIMAVELFRTAEGLVLNELALRPHNSGHYSIEGCETSQFEQHLRAVLDWPLGATDLRSPAVVTVNVVGPADGSEPAERVAAALAVPGAHVHLYGKASRPGRKLGHVTVCGDDLADVRAAARRAAAILEGRAGG